MYVQVEILPFLFLSQFFLNEKKKRFLNAVEVRDMNEIHSPHFGIFHLFIFSKLGFLCRNCNYAKVHIFMVYLFI